MTAAASEEGMQRHGLRYRTGQQLQGDGAACHATWQCAASAQATMGATALMCCGKRMREVDLSCLTICGEQRAAESFV